MFSRMAVSLKQCIQLALKIGFINMDRFWTEKGGTN